MSVSIGHASIDERGQISGGQAGDQTRSEVCIRSWYDKGWNKVIRPKHSDVAEKIAAAMEAACANDNIGYDQSQRTTLYSCAKAVDWNISSIKVPCETDCSALVAVCVNAAGITVSKDIYTGNEAAALQKTGAFSIFTDSSYLRQDSYLRRGDILLKEGSHTAVVLSDGSKTSSGTNPGACPTYTSIPISSYGTGLCITADALNIRLSPGGLLTGKVYKKGQTVPVKAKAFVNASPWFQTLDGCWISARYLTGWVMEQDGRWWYLLEGYTWYQNTAVTIDGKVYCFGDDGYWKGA